MQKRILIIEDSKLSRMAIGSCIPEGNYLVFEAQDGAEGIDLFKDTNPDMTFLDVVMPNIDGFETLRRLKGLDGRAKIVMLTADSNPKAVERALSYGALLVINKPPMSADIEKALSET